MAQYASTDLTMRFETPKSWIEYPMQLTKQTFVNEGDDDNFSVDGSYEVTIETLLKTVMRWELVLAVRGPLQDRAFYQLYAQISSQ